MKRSEIRLARPEVFERISGLLSVVVTALVMAFCYFASSFCVTILLASFLSIVVDPLISYLAARRIPRSLSAASVILAGMLCLGLASQVLFSHASHFAENLPGYAEQIRTIAEPLTQKLAKVEESADKLASDGNAKTVREVKVKQPAGWPSYLIRGFGSLSSTALALGVVPFLMFFMLTRKAKWYTTVAMLLGARENPVEFSKQVASMVRRFIAGNVIVGIFMVGVTTGLLAALHVHGAVILGVISGILNLVPFLGAILAVLLPMTAALVQSASLATILLIGTVIVAMHLVAGNLLIPRFVGSRTNIGPVAATAGILFWGWLWGVMGVLLAIPLTGVMKLIADCHPSLTRLSHMLGASTNPETLLGPVDEERDLRKGAQLHANFSD